MTLTQDIGGIVLAAIGVRVAWWLVGAFQFARHEARLEKRRGELNRFIREDYQRDAQIARLRGLQQISDAARQPKDAA